MNARSIAAIAAGSITAAATAIHRLAHPATSLPAPAAHTDLVAGLRALADDIEHGRHATLEMLGDGELLADEWQIVQYPAAIADLEKITAATSVNAL